MAKMELDTILRCANADCCHNREGYNCTCVVIALDNKGRCALYRSRSEPTSYEKLMQCKSNTINNTETSK